MEIEEVAAHAPGENPARGDRPGLRHFRLPRPQAGLRAGAGGQADRRVRANSSPAMYQAFIALDCRHRRNQPAGGDRRGRGGGAGCQGELRRQRAVPPSRSGEAARRGRGGPEGAGGGQAQPELRGAGRHHRLHGERRRAGHGDDGHHQAVRRRAGQFPRCRRRRDEGTGDGGVQDHPVRPATSKGSWSTSSAASCAAT